MDPSAPNVLPAHPVTRMTSPPRVHRTPLRRFATAIAVALVLVVSGCGSGDEAADERPADTRSDTSADTATDGHTGSSGFERPECSQGATGDGGEVTPVDDVASDLTIESFDGTEIRAHWFPADTDDPAPTILMGPGWSLGGDTSLDGGTLFGALGIGDMNDAGYNVLTWDPRGFGASTGAATVNAPETEGRDVQVLLDWVSEQPEARLDDDGDPRVGMVGASYGGGIQLTVAAIDCRVDALVPSLAWHSLETGLFRNETVKAGWASTLVDVAAAAELDPHVTHAADSIESGVLSDDDLEWFRSRGPGDLVDDITAPTLFVQGTVDTLFTVDEAILNHRSLAARGVPTGMLWFCGGHGTCLTHRPDTGWITDATFAWLDRWVKGDESIDTGPAIVIEDQHGDLWSADAFPDDEASGGTGDGEASDAGVGAASGGGTLPLVAEGGAGPLTGPPPEGDPLGALVLGITPARATNAVELPLPSSSDDANRLLLGAPVLTITYSGTVPDGPEPTRVFAQLVDEETGTVVGNQITPVPVVLDGAEHTTTIPLETIAHEPGGGLTLQLVATTVSFSVPRLGGEVTFSAIELTVPVATALAPA